MKYPQLFLVCATIVSLTIFSGCGSDEETIPDNEITDASGLDVTLEWSTGGSVTQSQTDVDLDLFIRKGTQLVDSSDGLQFETAEIRDILADGDFQVEVLYFNGSKAVNYTLFVKAKSSSRVIEYKGSLASTDENATIVALSINKRGTRYRMSR